MKVSIIIPVWNGASTIRDCLSALLEQAGINFCEVICVDNASVDESASLITALFPQVRLLRQPVNLGFAGGVNVGVEAAKGDAFILLNQDCIVQPGWLTALIQALESAQGAILGCLILSPDGSVDHIGARIQRPEALGVHITENNGVEYVSGASFAFHRRVWEKVGRFDEGFYPAYYEDADYCFRARRYSIETLCIPQARVVHLRSSEEWRINPLRYKANYHTVRYRFACKHFAESDLKDFFEAEKESIESGGFLEDILWRAIAARRTLFLLHEVVKRRETDLGEGVSPVLAQQVRTGLGVVLQEAMAQLRVISSQPLTDLSTAVQSLQSLQQREYALVQRIYFRSPLDRNPEPWLKRVFRLFILRPLSFLTGREHLLLAELNTLHTMRMDRVTEVIDQTVDVIDRLNNHLKLLETLIGYEGQW